METETLWRRFQQHMGYTDAEMAVFRSDPQKVKMVTETPEFVRSRIVAEVVESHGCHARHTGPVLHKPSGQGHRLDHHWLASRDRLLLRRDQDFRGQPYTRAVRDRQD